jgi:hypothetical protein
MVKALDAYTLIWRKGCTPPSSTSWTNPDNNKAFLDQTIVMTANTTLSIPAALRTAMPDDYNRNAVTIDWPNGVDGRPLVIYGFVNRAVVFKAGNSALAQDFVRFLAEEGWLAHWLDFAGDQFQPPMRKLVEQPFWLDTSDPHRMRAAIQILTRTSIRLQEYGTTSGDRLRSSRKMSGGRPSTAWWPRASPPSRRSTRQSPASSRSWRSKAANRFAHATIAVAALDRAPLPLPPSGRIVAR